MVNAHPHKHIRWRLGILAGVAMMLLSLYPQFKLWSNRGKDWNGAYAYNDIDEVAYAAYLQALIDGRPRKNDPYTGRDDGPQSPQPESLFSIQFLAPYMIAVPARLFGISSASTAMIILSAFAAFTTALAIFWLIAKFTDDERYAAAGSLIVLCLGTLAAGEGAIYELTKRSIAYPYLPFLRRYVPALPFPFFFMMCGAMWTALNNDNKRNRYLFALISAICFAVQVYSYFYLWTTALAWLIGLMVLWLIIRPEGWRKSFEVLLFTIGVSLVALVPYALLLSKRSRLMDEVQLLARSHKPDLLRMPEVICYIALFGLLIALFRGAVLLKSKHTVFALSFIFVPVLIFNQQIITGRSLQPIHYQVFIGNYVAALAILLTFALLRRGVRDERTRLLYGPVLILLTVFALVWGLIEVKYTTRVLDEHNIVRDEAVPVERRLAQLGAESKDPIFSQTVLNINFIQADDQPTFAQQPVLWSRHQHIFAGVGWTENKERFYQLLYYAGLNEDWLNEALINGDSVTTIALFGWGRITDRLTVDQQPLTPLEIDTEVSRFADYINTFNRERAANPRLSYVVVHTDFQFNFTKLDQWYERDEGEQLGKFKLYKVKLREH